MSTYSYPSDFKGTSWRVFDGDFYVSYAGDDRNDGSPRSPLATLGRAAALAASGQKIVAGSGRYNENVNGAGKSCFFASDGTVEMYGTITAGSAFRQLGDGAVVSGFSIHDYVAAVTNTAARFENCFIHQCDINAELGALQGCVLKNVSIAGDVDVYRNCTFIGVDKSAAGTGSTVENCHFDSASDFAFSSAALEFFDYCNQESGSAVRIDGTSYATAAAVHAAFPDYQANGSSVLPAFNSPSTDNYTLLQSSPLVESGSHTQPVGAQPQALSYDARDLGRSTFKGVVYDTDGYLTLPEDATEGTVETFVIDLGEPRVVGPVDLFAEQYFSPDYFGSVTFNQDTFMPPRPVTFEMRYANNDKDIQKASYKEFIWNRQPTVDANGFGNGSRAYNPQTERILYTRYVQLRITLRHTSDAYFILEEDMDLILQENGSKLKTENA